MSPYVTLNSKEAVQYVIDEFGFRSCYAIAIELSRHRIKTVQTGQISKYLKGQHVMGEKMAELFYVTFGVEIADAYRSTGRPSEW